MAPKKQINLRLSPEMLEALDQRAIKWEEQGLSRNALIEHLLTKALQTERFPLSARDALDERIARLEDGDSTLGAAVSLLADMVEHAAIGTDYEKGRRVRQLLDNRHTAAREKAKELRHMRYEIQSEIEGT